MIDSDYYFTRDSYLYTTDAEVFLDNKYVYLTPTEKKINVGIRRNENYGSSISYFEENGYETLETEKSFKLFFGGDENYYDYFFVDKSTVFYAYREKEYGTFSDEDLKMLKELFMSSK